MTVTEGTAAARGVTPRWVEYHRLDDLAARIDERNAKGHDIDDLRRSLGRFGYTAPIEVDERTGLLAAGHGRVELLSLEQAAGDVDLPEGLIVDDDGMWRAPVVRGWQSANDDEAEAYLVTANRLVETGGWNLQSLVASLDRVNATPLGLAGVGYVEEDLTRLAAQLSETTTVHEHERRLQDREDVDEIPPLPVEPVTQRGDVWLLGPHRIMCGDSRSEEDMATLLDGETADVIFTSPPYNVGIKYDVHDDKTKPWSEYRPLLDDVLNAALPYVIDGGAVCWNIGVSPKVHPTQQMALLAEHGLAYHRTMLWLKVGTSLPVWHHTQEVSRARVFTPGFTFEFVYVMAKGERLEPGATIEVTDVLKYDTFTINQREATQDLREQAGDALAHPAAFPVALPSPFINALCDVGARVLDPFCGAGSTLLAAHDEQRVGVGMELSPGYVDVALTRWERLTGIVPVHAGTGAPRSFVDV